MDKKRDTEDMERLEEQKQPGQETEQAESAVAEEPQAQEGVDEGHALSPIRAFTANEGVEEKGNLSLREILGGDILTADWLRRQMGLILLCVLFAVLYITNRYSAEQERIEIERLKGELTEIRYHALTRTGELTVRTRQSQVEAGLSTTADSVLQMPKTPPFLIGTGNEED